MYKNLQELKLEIAPLAKIELATCIQENKIDIVFLIEDDISMKDHASAMGKAAILAFQEIKEMHNIEVDATWLRIDHINNFMHNTKHSGILLGKYTQSCQNYFRGNGIYGPFAHDHHDTGHDFQKEQGADSIADVMSLYAWSKDSCRSIFYIGNSALENSAYSIATENTLKMAQKHKVRVFAHRTENTAALNQEEETILNQKYQDFCQKTGGNSAIKEECSENFYKNFIKKSLLSNLAGFAEVKNK